jgi:hypothetical protein
LDEEQRKRLVVSERD